MSVIDNFVAPACLEAIDILYRDEHILLINKPSGLLSLSGKNPRNRDSVHFRLQQQFDSVSLAHRLDLGTSGIMVLALTKSANTHLTKQFQERRVTKTYHCIVSGHVELNSGKIEASIAKDPALFPRLKICPEQGKAASSEYRVIERLESPRRTRLLYTPLTGRTHQLRIHSHAIGHPILGCDLYGTAETHAMANRLLLHATTLEFNHPACGDRVQFECPCPF